MRNKKYFVLTALLALVFAFSANVALAAKPTSTWQEWRGFENRLIVHVSEDSNSAICFDGKREDYSGNCVSPEAETTQYREKQNAINSSKTYVDQDWINYYGGGLK